MSSTPYVVVQQYPAISGLVTVVTALVSTNTVINLSSIFTAIATVLGMRQDLLTSINTSVSGNTFTVTQAGMANVYVTFLVGGTR
jgi:hypothetical protein